MTLLELALVALQVILLGAVGWSLASLLISRFFADLDLSAPERALAAIGGAGLFATAGMIVHIATGGEVFDNPLVIPVAAVAVMAAAVRARAWRTEVPWRVAVPVVFLLLAVFVVPVFMAGSSVREGDPPWHMGWTQELLAGQPLPDGPAPEFGRNAYPWGWHGVLATTTRLVPGSTPLSAHESLHVLLVLAIPLTAACLARRVRRGSGLLAAGAAALIAGFGWVSAQQIDFVASPTEARYGADLVAASPNSVYELLPPALPREMGLVLLGICAVLLLLATRDGRPALWWGAGIMAGCSALVSFPMLIPALAWATIAAFSGSGRRFRNWLRTVVPAVALFLLWLGPVFFWYLTEGGFVDIVPVLGVEWPITVALASWGLLFPLSVAGAVLVARIKTSEAKALLGFGVVSVVMIGLAVARRKFGWGLLGNETLLHQGRMWPVAHLLGAAFAGIALAHLSEWISSRSRRGANLVVASTFLVGSISLWLAVPGVTRLIEDRESGFVYAADDLAAGSFVRAVASHLSPSDVVTVNDPELAFKLFEFSGVSLSTYDDPRLEGNELRIRYRDLADAYMRRAESSVFDGTHVLGREDEDVQGHLLEVGEYRGEVWHFVSLR